MADVAVIEAVALERVDVQVVAKGESENDRVRTVSLWMD